MTALLRSARTQLPVVVVSALFAVLLLYLVSERGEKLLVVALGAVLVGGGAALSGNVRLFCLWGFVLTLPFDLSYRLGPVFAKLGGETSFRFELSDLFWLPLLAYQLRDLSTGAMRGVRIPKVTFIWIAIALMGMGAVISGPWRMTAFHEVVRMAKIGLMFIVLCNELRTPGRIMQVALALAAAIVLQSAAGIGQYLLGTGFGLEKLGEADVVSVTNVVKGGSVTRIGAFMVHPVIFATFLATLLPIAVGQVLLGGRVRRPFFGLAVLLGVPALVLTLSRAGWLTFAISSGVLALLVMLRLRLRSKAILPLAAAAAVVIAFGLAFAEPIMSRVYQSNTESARGRSEWAGDAKRMIDARPILGFGLNSYAFAAPPYTRLGERGAREFYEKARFARTNLMPVVHDAYLQWTVEIGVVGLLMHLSIFAVLLFMGWRNLRVHEEQLYVLNAACIAGLVGYLVDLNFGNSLRQGSTLREFWVLAALICTIHYWRLRHEGPVAARSSPRPAVPSGAEPVAG